jgi:hypothetical protein
VDKRILEVYLEKMKFCPIIPQFVAGKGKRYSCLHTSERVRLKCADSFGTVV